MSLPIRTTLADVESICGYLVTKPTGATTAEAKAVLDGKVLDGRKMSAFRQWGFIEENGEKSRVTERGRNVVRDKGARKSQAYLEAVASQPPYRAIIERCVHKREFTISATDVAAHWFEHFPDDVSDSDKILNDQAVCFFQLAEGADLGKITIGRHGQSTRFDFDETNSRSFVESGAILLATVKQPEPDPDQQDDADGDPEEVAGVGGRQTDRKPDARILLKDSKHGNRVFITHGKDQKILDQVKELVAYGKFEPVVAQERETLAKPVPAKVMDEMRSCQAAVIHVSVDRLLQDKDGHEVAQINANVLIEIGAAMALYGPNFILLVEEGVELPSNLKGLYECRYAGSELNMKATMKLLKAFNEFQ